MPGGAAMASPGSTLTKEEDGKKMKITKNRALKQAKQVDMAAPPQDDRKQKKNKKMKAWKEAEIAVDLQVDGKQKKNNRKDALQHQKIHGAHGDEDGENRTLKQKPLGSQRVPEPEGFKQTQKKDKENIKRKHLGLKRDRMGKDDEKRKSKKQMLGKQEQHKDKNVRNNWERQAEQEVNEERAGGRGGLIADPRFAAAHSDPRFQRLPTRESKVVIDSRFSRMFSEKGFASSSAPVDKRGRPRKEKADNPLRHYYHRGDEDEGAATIEKGEEEDERASGSEEGQESSSSEEDDSEGSGDDSDVGSSTEDDDDVEEDIQSANNSNACQFWIANQEDAPKIENETCRLAVVNMDWDHIKAIDLYVLMSTCLLTSCSQSSGQVLSVAVYPSDFGLKCMEIEAVRGPHALFGDNNDSGDDNDCDDADDERINEKIRSYQFKRLKYYYAVVECDSSATANHLYNSLDGVEFLRTANVLDLRFIPDYMEFKYTPRDIATEVPPDYKQPDFETSALQHSTVKLTWDDDEPDRKKTLRRKFNPEKMDELEQYLASDDSDDNDDRDVDGEGHGERYNALLQSADTSGTDEDNESGKEMEVTFLPGVENLSKHIDKNKLKKSEGVWDAYLRKRREKLKARKKSRKLSSDDDSSDSDGYNEALHQPDDFFAEEPSDADACHAKGDKEGMKKGSAKAATKNRRKDRKEQQKGREEETGEATAAELELLLADDDANNEHLKGFNLRPKKSKGKKGREVPLEDKLPDVDASSDARFSSRLISHLYALDPTDPQYKRSMSGMRQARAQKQSKGSVRSIEPEENNGHPAENEEPTKKEDHSIMSLVRSLKLKSRALADGSKGGA